jgi:Tol biopolymer transport system component
MRRPDHTRSLVLATAFAVAAAHASPASAQHMVQRVSVDANGAEAIGASNLENRRSMSADGRWIVFTSTARYLAPGKTNYYWDAFVTDRLTHEIHCVSLDPSGKEGNGYGFGGAVSSDGRLVFFYSDSTNLVVGDTNGSYDVFVRDRDPDGNGVFDEGNDTTQRVSVANDGSQGNASSYLGPISPDGRFVVFGSPADNLVAGDTNNAYDVFVRDRLAGTTTRASVDSTGVEGDGDSGGCDITADGRWVLFNSVGDNLVANDGNGRSDIFLRDTVNGVTIRVSGDPAGNDGDGDCWDASMNADATLIAFQSYSDNLVANDTNGLSDVFLHDLNSGVTTLQSVSTAGVQGDGSSVLDALSLDGKFLLFSSDSQNLVPQQGNGNYDSYLRDLGAGVTTCATLNCAERFGDYGARAVGISDDDKVVAIDSLSDNLVAHDENGDIDVFAVDTTIPDPKAAAANYGSGFPGTNGIPTLTASSPPFVGDPFSIDLANSWGPWTVGLLVVGTGQTSFVTRAGGTWLVDQLVIVTTLPVAPGGITLSVDLANDPGLCGIDLDLQVLESDPGAAFGISFTPGLALSFGA